MWILYPEPMCVTIRTQLNSTVCSQRLQPANSPEQVRKQNGEAIYGEDTLLTIHNHSNWSLFIMVMNSGCRSTLWISRQEPQQTRISTDRFGSRMHRSVLDNAREWTFSSVHRAVVKCDYNWCIGSWGLMNQHYFFKAAWLHLFGALWAAVTMWETWVSFYFKSVRHFAQKYLTDMICMHLPLKILPLKILHCWQWIDLI